MKIDIHKYRKKNAVYQKQAEMIKALSHPLRIAIIDFLKDGGQCVCDIAHCVCSERSNVSRHLSIMTSAGILEHRKSGLNVIYTIKCPCVLEFLDCIKELLKQNIKSDKKLLEAF